MPTDATDVWTETHVLTMDLNDLLTGERLAELNRRIGPTVQPNRKVIGLTYAGETVTVRHYEADSPSAALAMARKDGVTWNRTTEPKIDTMLCEGWITTVWTP